MSVAGSSKNLDWKGALKSYEISSTWRALWQLVNTMFPYLALVYGMFISVEISYWLLLPLWILTTCFYCRIFVINHDCGHGSFLKSRFANAMIGRLTAFLACTPFEQWKHSHAVHHKTSGKLNSDNVEYNIWTLSTDMYASLSFLRRLQYRLMRNPLIVFFIDPLWYWLVTMRMVHTSGSRYRLSVYGTNLCLLGVFGIASMVWGFGTVALILLPPQYLFGVYALWMFYIQHQYEDAYWKNEDEWNFVDAALRGSSYYKLPRVLQWITGNIGFHHVHHLSSRIPNYFLERCHTENLALFGSVPPLSLWHSFRYARLALWDVASERMITFREYRKRKSARVSA